MLRDIVQEIVRRQPDVELLRSRFRLAWPWRRVDADVVICSAGRDAAPFVTTAHLRSWPHPRVILIEPSGRQSTLYELRPTATALGDLSPEQLVDAIRRRPPAGDARDCGPWCS